VIAALEWLDTIPGMRRDEPLAPHTTYRIGGPAERYLETRDEARAAAVVGGCHERGIPLLPIGSGSNLLVADAGVEGLVLHLVDRAVEARGDRTLFAAAGTRMVKLAQAAHAAGLAGLEWALGIPGCVGGSVCNNAGCFGGDMAGVVEEAVGVLADGSPARWAPGDCAFRYRGSAFRDGALAGALVTGAVFRLRPGDPAQVRARMDEVQRLRHETQPVTGRSTGSVFKNPPGDHAARLIDAAGLKGRRSGGAMVSPEHANFIVNAGGAHAADVAALVREVQDEVRRRFGVDLETEIEAVGRWPAQ